MLASGSLLAGSIPTLTLAGIGIVWFLLAPLAEEPWLREEYGGEYESYCETVPRFIGRATEYPGKTDTEEPEGNSR
jgi:protein-S-isoprenylcysteine O-methyltransferase Ste14